MSDYDAACDYQYCGKWNDTFAEKSGGRLIDEAPTYAAILGVDLPDTDGTPVREIIRDAK